MIYALEDRWHVRIITRDPYKRANCSITPPLGSRDTSVCLHRWLRNQVFGAVYANATR